MLLRQVPIIAVTVVACSGAIAVAKPSLPSFSVIAQNSTNSARPLPSPRGWFKDLNLTPNQIQQIQAIRKQSRGKIAQKRQALRQAQQQLQALLASTASKQQVQDKYNQVRTLRQELADAQFENTLAIREILTPEQRQKFAEYMYKQQQNSRPRRQN
jgi:Spy/CpxP family protein refolding chaperone